MTKRYLITGGAGFVGSFIALELKKHYQDIEVIAFDNLKRRGSEFNLPRLKEAGISFVHGDVRNREDLASLPKIDVIVECSAEPSVTAGYGGSPDYVLNTNLNGTINCLEKARQDQSDFIFLSTSRVYPMTQIDKIVLEENSTRMTIAANQPIPGISEKGISEQFPLEGCRSMYGASKLCSEYIINEYIDMYGLRGVINRCGVLTGPWQMGKVDQGVVVLWVAKHIYEKKLSYIGYGGTGKQVRDILHVSDLCDLLFLQLDQLDQINGQIFNVGGGVDCSLSLLELTELCQRFTGNSIPIDQVPETRAGDIAIYLTDNTKVQETLGWSPKIGSEEIIREIAAWITDNKELLRATLS